MNNKLYSPKTKPLIRLKTVGSVEITCVSPNSKS